MVQPKLRIARDGGDTHRVRADGRHVDLACAAPVELRVVAPRFNSILPAEPEAAPVTNEDVETRPFAHERAFAIGADQPRAAERAKVDPRTPTQADARGCGVFRHDAVKRSTPDAATRSGRKVGRDIGAAIVEANAAEGKGVRVVDAYAETRQGGESVRHQTFSTGFIGRRKDAVEHGDRAALRARGESGGQARRASAYDDDIGIYHCKNTRSAQRIRMMSKHHRFFGWSSPAETQTLLLIAEMNPIVAAMRSQTGYAAAAFPDDWRESGSFA
jgi:hypothetical protein